MINYKTPIALLLITLVTACQTAPRPVHGSSNPTPAIAAKAPVKYYGSIVGLRPEKEKEYRELQANVWPEVCAAIRKAHIRNYNIYVTQIGKKRFLVSFFEYTGTDPDRDFASIAKDPTTKKKWWPLTDACQIRLPGTAGGQQWRGMEKVMHLE